MNLKDTSEQKSHITKTKFKDVIEKNKYLFQDPKKKIKPKRILSKMLNF